MNEASVGDSSGSVCSAWGGMTRSWGETRVYKLKADSGQSGKVKRVGSDIGGREEDVIDGRTDEGMKGRTWGAMHGETKGGTWGGGQQVGIDISRAPKGSSCDL